MKRSEFLGIPALLLAIAVFLNGVFVSAVAEDANAANHALAYRGVQYGFVPAELLKTPDEPVSYAQFCAVLSKMIKMDKNGEAAKRFEADAGDGMIMEEPMTREAGMLALFYAADCLRRSANYGDGFGQYQYEGVWNEMRGDFGSAFPGWDAPYHSDIDCVSDQPWDNRAICALFYTMTLSCGADRSLMLDFDVEAKSFHLDRPFTCLDAALSAVRLFDSNPANKWYYAGSLGIGAEHTNTQLFIPEDVRQSIESEFAARRDAILDSANEIRKSDTFIPGETYTGTAFYVSPDGNDESDGRTPKTAWRTIGKVNDMMWNNEFKRGDAIFFERGGVYRTAEAENSVHVATPGITYSAYGEGDKPLLTDSEESGVGAEKWTLYYKGEDGVKIWAFYRALKDTAAVVLNRGEVYATRQYEYWDIGAKSYVSVDMTLNPVNYQDSRFKLADRLRSPEETLTEDLTIISRPDLSKNTQYPVNIDIESGPLYFRCDAGNPGELYDTVEFVTRNVCGTFWLMADDTVIDNLNMSYAGVSFVKNGLETFVNGTVVQNCEFAFGGAAVVGYSAYEPGLRLTTSGGPGAEGLVPIAPQGDGLYNLIDATIKNNYFHDINGSAITTEGSMEYEGHVKGDFLFSGNVLDGTTGIRLDYYIDSMKYLDSVIVENNMVLNTGRRDIPICSSESVLLLTANHFGECIVRDNVFWCTENGSNQYGLIGTEYNDYQRFRAYAKPVYENNTFVQHAGKLFMIFYSQDELWYTSDPRIVQRMEEDMGMTDCTLYLIPD